MIGKILLLKKRYIIILLFCFLTVEATILNVTPELQPGSYVCWAACADMMLMYYGNPPNLHGIWVSGTDGNDQENGLCSYYPGAPKNVQEILAFGNPVRNVSSACHSGAELSTDLQNNITNCKPIMAGLEDDVIWGHLVLIVGFDANNNVFFNDPASGTLRNMPYDVFCSNSSFYWSQTLIPTTGSPACQTPVENPYINISSGPTQFTYPGANATYTSGFYCPPGQTCMPVTQWNWSLSFGHKNGDYVVSSIQNIYGYNSSTWNISAFTLPTTGYQWNYNADGLVTGVVNVSTGGYSDWQSVTYAPQIVIPGHVDFENQTVSGSHPDVAAHYCININNVSINAGASIAFVAGTCCTINNITVQNGSNAIFTIDPSLQ